MTVHIWSVTVAAIVLAPFLALAPRVLPETAREAFALLVLGVVFTGLSGLLYLTLLGHVTAQAAGVLAFIEPVSASLLAWALLDQTPDRRRAGRRGSDPGGRDRRRAPRAAGRRRDRGATVAATGR